MFCNKTSNHLINRTHKRALRVIQNDTLISYEEVLTLTGSKYLHTRNLELLMTEVYKSLNSLNPKFMHEIFAKKDSTYQFRADCILKPPFIDKNQIQFISLNSLELRSTLAWNKLPNFLKNCKTIVEFKSKIDCVSVYCNCKICA